MSKPNLDHAKAIAAALEEKGITNDLTEEAPNPFWAAQEAFYVCQGQRSGRAWRELRDWLTGPTVPRSAYHRKIAEYCLRALRRPDIPEELREPISYTWGYHDGIAYACRKIEAEIEGSECPTDK